MPDAAQRLYSFTSYFSPENKSKSYNYLKYKLNIFTNPDFLQYGPGFVNLFVLWAVITWVRIEINLKKALWERLPAAI